MSRFILRVWLDDRPGALGAVASRIGSVRGDLVGIEILERGAGRVIDELIVDLPSDDLLDLMVREVQEVDGVDVENIGLEPRPERDPRLDPILSVAIAIEQDTLKEVVSELCQRVCSDFMASWCTIYDISNRSVIDSCGESPLSGWVRAYVDGVLGDQASTIEMVVDNQPSDLALTLLKNSGLALILGRSGRPFRDLERMQLGAICRISDVKLALLVENG